MAEPENIQRAKDGYAAILRGDIPGLMEMLADDIEWVDPGPSDLPWPGVYHGREAVLGWFGVISQQFDFSVFEPQEFFAQGDKVVVLVHQEVVVRRNGRTVVNPEVHVWTFRNGKVGRLQTYVDTAAIAAAYRGE